MESTLTYKTLYDSTINTIVAVCKNVPNNSAIPASMKPGYSATLASIQGSGGSTNPPQRYYVGISNPIYGVAESTVRNAFQSFMSSRGIYSKLNTTVNGRGILNFLSNVAVFCRTHICRASSPFEGTAYTIYSEAGSAMNISQTALPDYVTATEVADMTTIIKNVLAANLSTYLVRYSYNLTCSSSSSSSSSTSCSSSCSSSSSSSWFIAFMKL